MIKKLLFIYLLTLVNFAFATNQWMKIGKNQELQITVYIHNFLIEKPTHLLAAKILYSFANSNYDRKLKHQSEIETVRFDCKNRQFVLLNVEWYLRDMGLGPMVWRTNNLEPQLIQVGSAYEEAYKAVCKK